MKNSPDRIFNGIIQTLRADVLPHVTEAYARGQTLAAIDLLGNLAPMMELAKAPLRAQLAARRDCITDIYGLLPQLAPVCSPSEENRQPEVTSVGDLIEQTTRLDDLLSEMVDQLFDMTAPETPEIVQARDRFRHFIRDQASYEMSQIQKPLFAEIATGKANTNPTDTSFEQ